MTRLLGALLVACGVARFAAAAPSNTPGFSDETIQKVTARMQQIASHSWEYGAEAEALTEEYYAPLAVYSPGSIPPPSSPKAVSVLELAHTIVANMSANATVLIDGDGAVGDPASLGVAVLLASRTAHDGLDYYQAATKQLQHLLQTNRTVDGAISQREDQVQLWADFVYMAPPFIAYYGALAGGWEGAKLLQEAYNQCRLYRQYLRDPDTNLWKHIVLGDWQDLMLWGTGAAWATSGMMRVLEAIKHSDQASKFVLQQRDLTGWVNELLTAVWKYQHPNGTLYNAINNSSTFGDTSSTAMLAAATYRYAALTQDDALVPAAEKALVLIQQSITDDGWLLNTVDPLSFSTPSPPGVYSPEGQSFVLHLHAAFRDYNSAKKKRNAADL